MSQYEKRKAKEKKVEEATVSAKYDTKAYDLHYNEADRKYYKVILEYELASGTARVKDLVYLADSQPVAVMKMNEIVARKAFRLPIE